MELQRYRFLLWAFSSKLFPSHLPCSCPSSSSPPPACTWCLLWSSTFYLLLRQQLLQVTGEGDRWHRRKRERKGEAKWRAGGRRRWLSDWKQTLLPPSLQPLWKERRGEGCRSLCSCLKLKKGGGERGRELVLVCPPPRLESRVEGWLSIPSHLVAAAGRLRTVLWLFSLLHLD